MGTMLYDDGLMSVETIDDSDGKTGGLLWQHVDVHGEPCMGYIELTDVPEYKDRRTGYTYGKPGHKLESRDPLSLSPSLLCPVCDAHGFIKKGEWSGTGSFRPQVWSLVATAVQGVWKLLWK